MASIEIYFSDLNKEAQAKYLKFENCREEDLNADVVPLFVLEK